MRKQAEEERQTNDEIDADHKNYIESKRNRFSSILGIDAVEINDTALYYFLCETNETEDSVRAVWLDKRWMQEGQQEDYDYTDEEIESFFNPYADCVAAPHHWDLSQECRDLIKEGETKWGLDRNAAAAGFQSVETYLKWRAAEEA